MNTEKKTLSIQWMKAHAMDLASYGGLILCILIFSIIPPFLGENIWSPAKLSTLMSDVIVTALMAVGAMFVYTLGNMDISIGAQVGIYATLMVLLGNMTGSLFAGIILAFVIAVILGAINGSVGSFFGFIRSYRPSSAGWCWRDCAV